MVGGNTYIMILARARFVAAACLQHVTHTHTRARAVDRGREPTFFVQRTAAGSMGGGGHQDRSILKSAECIKLLVGLAVVGIVAGAVLLSFQQMPLQVAGGILLAVGVLCLLLLGWSYFMDGSTSVVKIPGIGGRGGSKVAPSSASGGAGGYAPLAQGSSAAMNSGVHGMFRLDQVA